MHLHTPRCWASLSALPFPSTGHFTLTNCPQALSQILTLRPSFVDSHRDGWSCRYALSLFFSNTWEISVHADINHYSLFLKNDREQIFGGCFWFRTLQSYYMETVTPKGKLKALPVTQWNQVAVTGNVDGLAPHIACRGDCLKPIEGTHRPPFHLRLRNAQGFENVKCWVSPLV